MNNIVVISAETVTKMMAQAEVQCAKFANNVGKYNHNEVSSTTTSYMAEFAVRELYRAGGVMAIQNINNTQAPDLTIPEHTTLERTIDLQQEEVKCWATGNSWNNWGNTITAYHAERYERKGRSKVWFCEVNRETSSVIVHGWATPSECLQAESIITSSGLNHQLEVLHRCHEVMPWVEDIDVDGGWFQ
jgi:hypothetical protein